MPININKRSDVNSVNGKVGDVVLNASDIGALSKDTKIPTKTSDLTNDSNYISDANYVHTDNNYTNEDKDKLNNIADGAEVNVQANWSETDPMEDSFIKNKPTIPSKTSDLTNDSNYVVDSDYKHTDNNYTTADKNSVATIGNKVDKVEGKGLSTNDLTDELKADYDDAVLQAHTHSNKTILDNTTASYTTEEKTKLSGIENNAQKNTVIGVKGEVETDYRAGNVNITKKNIGLENVANERQWSETNHPTTMSGYGITDGASSTDYNTLKGRVDTNEDNIAMLDSDVEGLTTDVDTLKTDMTTVKGAVTTIQGNYVPKTRKVNGKALSADITLGASDVKAIPISQKGTANGVAELDANGLVPSSQLPSYVDDVLEYDTKTDFPTNGESGKIYIATYTNLQYRWTGTQYVEISPSLALGETSSTAYRGDRGKIAYDHSQKTSGNPHKVTKGDVGLGNVGNYKSVSVGANQGLTDTEKANARTNIGAGTSNFSGSYDNLTNKPTTFPPSAHNHDDRYYTESEMNAKLGTKVDLSADGVSKAINKLSTETATPSDADYYISQFVNGGTTTTSYHRRPVSALWSYIKSKADSIYAKVIHTHTKSQITDFPTSMPASDVSAWAKAKTKPSYTKSEVGLGNVDNTADSAKSVKYAMSLHGFIPDYQGFWGPVNAIPKSGTCINRMNTPNGGGLLFSEHDNLVDEVIDGHFYQDEGKYMCLDTNNYLSYASAKNHSHTTVNGHTVNSDVPSGAKFTDTWRPLGTTADTACAGNDSRLSNARPASDVYSWAKQAKKPTYNKSEVGLANVDNTADANKSVKNADKLYNKSNDYYGVWLGGMTISKGTEAGMPQNVVEDPLHRYIKPTSIIDIYYDDNSVQYASEIGMLYNIWESGGIYYLSVAPKKEVVKQDIVIQNILVRNP